MRVAVVGVGRWGKNHVRVLKHLENEGHLDEVIICDINKDLARKIAREYGIKKYYYDVREMISKDPVDGAIVSVPTLYHYKVAVNLLPKADLLIEKPITAELNEAATLIKLCEEYGRNILVGHIERFNQGLISLKEDLKKLKKLGDDIVYISAQRVGPGPARGKSLNLGVAHDLMVHDIDIISFILESFTKSVYASAKYTPEFQYEVEVNALFTFDNGAETIASLRASYRSHPTFKKRLLLIQTYQASVSFDYILQSYTVEKGVMEHRLSKDFMDLITAYRAEDIRVRRLLFKRENEPLLLEDKHFIEVIRGKKEPFISAIDGYVALKNILMALKSASKKAEIEIKWDEPFIDPSTYYRTVKI